VTLAALVVCGLVMFVASLAPFVFPAWRGLDRVPASAPADEVASAIG